MGVAVGPPAAFAALATAGVIALAGGPLAGIAVGALAAGGGVGALGALLAKSFNDQVVADFQGQIERGGILLWVSLRDPQQEEGPGRSWRVTPAARCGPTRSPPERRGAGLATGVRQGNDVCGAECSLGDGAVASRSAITSP